MHQKMLVSFSSSISMTGAFQQNPYTHFLPCPPLPSPQVLIINSEYPSGRHISNAFAKCLSEGHGYAYLNRRKPTKILNLQYTSWKIRIMSLTNT